MRNIQDLAEEFGPESPLQYLQRIFAILYENPHPPVFIERSGEQLELRENGAQQLVSKALVKRFMCLPKEQTNERTIFNLGNDLMPVFNQLLQMELELVLMSAQNHAYFRKHLTQRHPYTGTGARDAAFSARLYREAKSGKLIHYSIKILSYDDGVLKILASSELSCQLMQQYLQKSLLIPEDCFSPKGKVLKIRFEPNQLLAQIEQQRINTYSACVLNEEGSLVFPEFQKKDGDGTVRYTVSEGLCQDPYHPQQSLYSRLMHDFGIEIRAPRAENNFTRLRGTDGAVFLLKAGNWFLTDDASNKAKRSHPHSQTIPLAVSDYLHAEQEALQKVIRETSAENATVEIDFLAQENESRQDKHKLQKNRPRNHFGKIRVKEAPGLYEQMVQSNDPLFKEGWVYLITNNGGYSYNGITIIPDVENEGFIIEGIEPAAFKQRLLCWKEKIDILEDNVYFGDLELPNDSSLLLHLRQLSKELDKEPVAKRDIIVNKTREILKECTAFLESSEKSPEKVVSFIEKVKNYESELLHLSVKQKLLLTACSVIGTALGVVIGAALGLTVGALFYGGIASVAPVFGTVAGAIAGGSITGILLAIKGAGVGAVIGTAAGAFLGGLGMGAGSTHLVHRGFFSDSQRTVKKIATELIESLQRNQENTAEIPNSEKPEL